MSLTILIIDHEPDVIQQLREWLESKQHAVISAHEIKEGLTKARVLMPDVILIDMMMPHCTSAEVLKELKANSRTESIPVVFVSMGSGPSNSAERDAVLTHESAAYPVISKPLNFDVLYDCIENVLGTKITKV